MDQLSLIGLAELLSPDELCATLDALLPTVRCLDVRGTSFVPAQIARAAPRLEELCITLLPEYAADTDSRLSWCLQPLLRARTLRRIAISTDYEAGVAERLSELRQAALGGSPIRDMERRIARNESESGGVNSYADGVYFVDRAHLAAFDIGEARPDASKHCVSKTLSWSHRGPQAAATFETRTPCDCTECGDTIDWLPIHMWAHNWLRRRRTHVMSPVAKPALTTRVSSTHSSKETSKLRDARFGVLALVACVAFVVSALTRHFF